MSEKHSVSSSVYHTQNYKLKQGLIFPWAAWSYSGIRLTPAANYLFPLACHQMLQLSFQYQGYINGLLSAISQYLAMAKRIWAIYWTPHLYPGMQHRVLENTDNAPGIYRTKRIRWASIHECYHVTKFVHLCQRWNCDCVFEHKQRYSSMSRLKCAACSDNKRPYLCPVRLHFTRKSYPMFHMVICIVSHLTIICNQSWQGWSFNSLVTDLLAT